MLFRELISIAPAVRYTCFVRNYNDFEQWYPSKRYENMNQLDQVGYELKKSNVSILGRRIYRAQPTAYNYMNVYLY